jgi:hypothetical protein
MPGEAADMYLVNNRLGKGPTKWGIKLPVVRPRVDDNAPECRGSIVASAPRRLPVANGRSSNAFPVGVAKHLFWIETEPMLGIKGSSHPISIELARGDAGHKDMSPPRKRGD